MRRGGGVNHRGCVCGICDFLSAETERDSGGVEETDGTVGVVGAGEEDAEGGWGCEDLVGVAGDEPRGVRNITPENRGVGEDGGVVSSREVDEDILCSGEGVDASVESELSEIVGILRTKKRLPRAD